MIVTPPSDLCIDAAGVTDRGRRAVNADRYVCDRAGGLFMVADGMGDSELAAAIAETAVRAVQEQFALPWPLLPLRERFAPDALDGLYQGAKNANNRTIMAEAPVERRIGTSLACVALSAEGPCVLHAGVCRVYHAVSVDQPLRRLTFDHTRLETAIVAGIPPERARQMPSPHAMTSAIGVLPAPELAHKVVTWDPGDAILLCSKGISGRVSGDEMRHILLSGTASDAAEALVKLARAAGGGSNASAVVVRRLG